MALARRLNLFCIPYAGGTATAFRTLPDSLGPSIKFSPMELPGRGLRHSEPLCRTVEQMVDVLHADIAKELDPKTPYAIFGHTLGARLAYLIALKIQALGQPAPTHLFLGGEGPPEASPWRSEATAMERDDRFKAEVIGSGAYPEELIRLRDKWDELRPILRADLKAFDEYNPGRAPKLACPVTAILATRDILKREEAERWGRRTEGKFEVKMITGGHFFFMKQMPALGKAITDSLRGYF